MDFAQLWEKMCQNLQIGKWEETTVILRRIRLRRNHLIFENKFDSPSKVTQLALPSLEEFHEALALKECHQETEGNDRRVSSWSPPEEGIQINFDETIDSKRQKMGIFIIVTDFKGEILVSLCPSRNFVGQPILAESFALWRALELGRGLHFKNAVYEGIKGNNIQIYHKGCWVGFM